MKKKWLALLAAGLSVATVLSFAACAPSASSSSSSSSSASGSSDSGSSSSSSSDSSTPETTKATKAQVASFMESLTVDLTGVNTYATSYNDMVAYLKEQNVITSDATPINISETAGYIKKNDGTYDDKRTFADKAYDYDGVWLFWWDIKGGSSNINVYDTMAYNDNVMVIGGGFYTLPATAYSGCYAIAFKDVVEAEFSYMSDGSEAQGQDESNEDFATRKAAGISAAKEKIATKLAVFNAIDNTIPSVDYYRSISVLAQQLLKAGLITNQEFAKPTNLNSVYTYTYTTTVNEETVEKTGYVALATSAYQYGNITIYYFNTKDSLFSYYTYSAMWTNLNENKTTDVYYNASGSSYTPSQEYKCTGTAYDENGTTLTYSVDGVYGNFAISVAEEA